MHLSQRLGLQWPLIQAPMAGVQTSALAVAVCRTGALGSLPAAMFTPQALHDELQRLQAQCEGRAYNVNFFCHSPPPSDDAAEQAWRRALAPHYQAFGINAANIPAGPGRQPFSAEVAQVLAAFKPAVVSFHFGLPDASLLAAIKAWGAMVLSSATTVDEARWLQAHGADAIIAQGLEAGGHRGHFLSHDLSLQMGTLALLPQVVRAVTVPVVAAGGIADAAGVAAAMALGASAVQVGTAYLLSDEATTSAVHRAALASPQAAHTALTNVFTGRPARGIVNRVMRELGPISPLAPAFPLATSAVAPLRTAAEAQGSGDYSPLWSGQNASACRAASAADITLALAAGFGAAA